MEDIIRILRLVEYTGPRSLVEEQVVNSIHGTRSVMWGRGRDMGYTPPFDSVRITAVTITQFPEILKEARQVPDPKQFTEMEQRFAALQKDNQRLHEALNALEDKSYKDRDRDRDQEGRA